MERIKIIGSGSPKVCIISIVHGNEPCGLYALDLVEKLILKKGTLILIKANIEAYKEDKRFIEINLNRVFPGKAEGLLEERTAYEISKYIYDCDYVLDLHSASEETPPFAIISQDNPENIRIISQLGISECAILGKVIEGSTLYGNGIRIAVECGKHKSIESIENAMLISQKFLIASGLIEGKTTERKLRKFSITGTINIEKKEFFIPSSNLKSFVPINQEDIIGTYKDGKLFIATESFMPLLVDKEMKEELLFKAKEI